jgi:hypothetical protein
MAPARNRASNRRNRPANRIEVLVGRSAALCVHPLAAWRSRSRNDRALLVISYVAISYVIVFGLLHVISA